MPPNPVTIRPVDNLTVVQTMTATYWTPKHPVGNPNDPMAAFYLATPWVDQKVFPAGISVLGAWHEDRCLGISCVQVTPDAAWHVIWFVTPEAKGQGVGRRLLLAMREAVQPKPLYVFGISKDGMPHYEKTGFQTTVALRWKLENGPYVPLWKPAPLNTEWVRYRFDEHPVFKNYERRGETIVRADLNDWGLVLHVPHLGADWPETLGGAFDVYDLVQVWACQNPGSGWKVPSAGIPTVFHPHQTRGNTLGVAGWPSLPPEIHGEDGLQGRWT